MFRILIILLLFTSHVFSQDLPLGYIKYHEANFQNHKKSDLIVSSDAFLKYHDGVLHLADSADSIRSTIPNAMLLADNYIFGDFITHITIKSKVFDKDSLSGFYIITGLRDSSNYYFLKMTSQNAGFYKMYRGEVSLIDVDSTFHLKDPTWQDLTITRDILKRTIKVANNGTLVEFSDPNLVMGFIGLGVSDYDLFIKKFTTWAPTAISEPANVFRK